MGKHRKPKSEGRHVKPPTENQTVKRAATLGAAAVALPTLALTFTPEAQAATTQTIPRVVSPLAAPPVTATPVVTAATCADYIVKHGDTFSGIAVKFGVPQDLLKPLNLGVALHREDYSLIFAGGHIHLPDGSCDPVSPPPVPAPTPAPSPGGHTWKHHQHRHHHWRHGGGGGGTPTPAPTPTPTPPPVVGGSTVPVIAPDGPGTPSGYVAHSPSFWGPLIEQAKSLVGVDYSTSQIESLMASESSGDPNAINNYDSNAQAGHPSKGLMQTIQSTFDGYHIAGTSSNIYDPLANLCSALNYIKNVYGYVPNSPY